MHVARLRRVRRSPKSVFFNTTMYYGQILQDGGASSEGRVFCIALFSGVQQATAELLAILHLQVCTIAV
jgi:hypothetical protein